MRALPPPVSVMLPELYISPSLRSVALSPTVTDSRSEPPTKPAAVLVKLP